MSAFSDCLSRHQFCILVEYLTSFKRILPVTPQLADYPAFMTLSDRVHSDDDIAPIDIADQYPKHITKLLHYAGKGRDIQAFEQFLDQAEQTGNSDLLLLTGDKLKQHTDGLQDSVPRTRYLESVNAVIAARNRQFFNIGVALNPFKYVEAETEAQYLKLHKKIKAGANFIITQLGFDLDCLENAQRFLHQYHYQQPLLACVMPLTLARAKFMLRHKVAGIVISPHILQLLEHESQINVQWAEQRVYARCALQILICQSMGYAGVHLSACHKPDEQLKLEKALKEFKDFSLSECMQLWNELWQIETGNELKPQTARFSKSISFEQKLKYKNMHAMHALLFNSKPAKRLGSFIFKADFWNKTRANRTLLQTEFISKHSVLGCESCGQCRIADTLYICPETCPKGLANGPCGGTTLDRCEFGDRECIHSIKARLAKAVQQTHILKEKLIPTVPMRVRGTSSWKNWYINAQD